ncbi:hypothetical protein KC480_05615 [Bacillus velezensis]|uniref:hypothetical protein n=1 Tax=Bacillus velezensis TaxID=492670 RepID=UPI001E658CE0|nr:hypothetical protein [Bacillus velezensis]MCD7911001.1 hypothetical protein [Bacillus velezensis]
MEWKELSRSAANVIERCWSIHHDNPLQFSTRIGDYVTGANITEGTFKDILNYQKVFPYFDVLRNGDFIIVKGSCQYGEWSNTK